MVLIDVEPDASAHAPPELPDALRRDAQVILETLGHAERELSILLCGDQTIQRLNAQFRDKDVPTDVLSFPQGEGPLLGDVVIDLLQAHRQATERGHSLGIEARILLAHGVLHLLGHRHDTPDALREMAEAEARVLEDLDVSHRGLVARSQ